MEQTAWIECGRLLPSVRLVCAGPHHSARKTQSRASGSTLSRPAMIWSRFGARLCKTDCLEGKNAMAPWRYAPTQHEYNHKGRLLTMRARLFFFSFFSLLSLSLRTRIVIESARPERLCSFHRLSPRPPGVDRRFSLVPSGARHGFFRFRFSFSRPKVPSGNKRDKTTQAPSKKRKKEQGRRPSHQANPSRKSMPCFTHGSDGRARKKPSVFDAKEKKKKEVVGPHTHTHTELLTFLCRLHVCATENPLVP